MAVTADGVWADDVLRAYARSLYPAALGIVKSRLHRARRRLRAGLAGDASPGDTVEERRRGGRPVGAWWVGLGSPGGPRSFDPFRIADLEYRMWVGYYLRRWTHVAAALIGLLRLGFGTDLARAAQGAFLMLRAVRLWAPFPDNDPDGAQACMRELYALVRLRYGAPADPGRAAALEVDWWRAHRERQYSADPAATGDELVESVTRLYCYLFGETADAVRPAAVHRVQAMDLSDQWVREGCQPGSPLLPLERAALVRAYAALLAGVHREEPR